MVVFSSEPRFSVLFTRMSCDNQTSRYFIYFLSLDECCEKEGFNITYSWPNFLVILCQFLWKALINIVWIFVLFFFFEVRINGLASGLKKKSPHCFSSPLPFCLKTDDVCVIAIAIFENYCFSFCLS